MLTQWNDVATDSQTVVIVIDDCDGDPQRPYKRPRLSYEITTNLWDIEATAQSDVTSDDRFQRIGRVHLSHRCQAMPQPFCAEKMVFSDDLASVWGIQLLSAQGVNGIVVPDFQVRVIQSVRGIQKKRMTVKYKPPSTRNIGTWIGQLHGVESTDLELWGWINPDDATLGAKVSLIFGVTVKMRPSSGDNIIFGDYVSPVP